ncbi:MAG: hypothetical protein ACREUW_19985 [Burkholderiales bacterium]
MHSIRLPRSAGPLAALLAVFALLAGCAGNPVGPGGVTSVNAPAAPKVGDQWAYEVSSGYSRTSKGVLRQRVVEASGNTVVIESSGFQEGRATITPDLQWLTHMLGDDSVNAFSPAYPALVFPLAAGQSWNVKVDGRVIQPQALGGSTGTNRVTVQGKVLGWERVKVPAGEFDAIRIRRVTFGGNFDDRSFGQSEITEELWYAPSIGRVVRSTSSWQRLMSWVQRGSEKYMLGDLTVMELLPAGDRRATLAQ